jgi:hypothetical protein
MKAERLNSDILRPATLIGARAARQERGTGSVEADIFLPPTLIASIYGMNFEHMPELKWLLGYPFSIGLMIASAILPYVYFKRRGWL